MRKLLVFLATGVFALGMAGVANAAVLNWTGSLTILWADYPSAEFTGGGVATINGSNGVIPSHLSTMRLAASRGQIQGTVTRLVTDPYASVGAAPLRALQYIDVGGLTGTFSQLVLGAISTSTGGGILPVAGAVKMCLLSTACTTYLDLILNEFTTVNGAPGMKGIGIGGLITMPGYGGIRFSLQGAPWTVKTATVLDQITPYFNKETEPRPPREIITWVARGWAHGPASSSTTTAQPGGMVQLVTPGQIVTNLWYGSDEKQGWLVIAVIHFIPEPGLLLLLGSGVPGLALVGRKRMRR